MILNRKKREMLRNLLLFALASRHLVAAADDGTTAAAAFEVLCDAGVNKCYSLTEERLAYPDAVEYCRSLGGDTHLAEPRTEEETSALSSLYPDLKPRAEFVWLGLDDLQEEGVFRWASDGQVLGDEYENWHRGRLPFRQEPDGGAEENCMIGKVSSGWTWNDYKCDRRQIALCQMNMQE